jgi:hypothetical protein
MIVLRISMTAHIGKGQEAIGLLKERDDHFEKAGLPRAARIYVKKFASPMQPEIIAEFEYSNFVEYEESWSKRMKPTPQMKDWSRRFDEAIVPGSMGYEIYDLEEP